jgi:hypothetical protein
MVLAIFCVSPVKDVEIRGITPNSPSKPPGYSRHIGTPIGGEGDCQVIEWGSIPPKSAFPLIIWTVLLFNIRLKLFQGNASTRGDEVRTCPKDWFTVKPINVFIELLAN